MPSDPAGEAIKQAADTINVQANQIGSGLGKFSGRGLDNVSALIDELRQSVAQIDQAVNQIQRNPSSIVFGGGSSGIRDYNRK